MKLLKAQKFNNALCLRYRDSIYYNGAETDKQTIQRLQKDLNSVNFKYNAIFNSADNCCVIFDRHLNVVDFNYEALRLIQSLFGKKLTVGQHVTTYLTAELLDSILDSCMRALSGDTFNVERQVHSNMGMSWWLAEYSPAYNDQHHVAGVVFNCVNITARKAHETEIDAQHKKLREIALIQSHDVRGPLCTLMGLINLIKREGLNGNANYLDMLDTTVAQLDKQIRAIIDRAS